MFDSALDPVLDRIETQADDPATALGSLREARDRGELPYGPLLGAVNRITPFSEIHSSPRPPPSPGESESRR